MAITAEELQIKITAKVNELIAGLGQSTAATQAFSTSLDSSATRIQGSLNQVSNSITQTSNRTQVETQRMSNAITGFQEVVTTRVGMVKTILGGMLAGFVTTFAILGTSGLFKGAIQGTDEMTYAAYRLSRQLGITADRAYAIQDALGDMQIRQEAFGEAAKAVGMTLQKNAEDLDRLGVKYKDASGNLLALDEVTLNAVEVLKQYKEGTDQQQVAMTMGRRGYQALIELTRISTETINDNAEALRRMGIRMNPDQVLKYHDALATVGDVGDMLKIRMGQQLLPLLTEVGIWFGETAPPAIETTIRVIKDFEAEIKTLGAVILAFYSANLLAAAFTAIVSAGMAAITVIADVTLAVKNLGIGMTLLMAIGNANPVGVCALALFGTAGVGYLLRQIDTVKAHVDSLVDSIADMMGMGGPAPDVVGAISRQEWHQRRLAKGLTEEPVAPPSPGKSAPAWTREGGGGSAKSSATNQLSQIAQAEIQVLRSNLERERKELDSQLALHLVSYKEYHDKIIALKNAEIDKEVQLKQAELSRAKDKGDRARIEADIAVLENQRAIFKLEADQKMVDSEKKVQKALDDTRIALHKATGQTTADERLKAVESKYKETLELMKQEGDVVGEEIVKKLINVEAAQGELSALETKFNETISHMQALEQSLNVQKNAGMITEYDMRERIVQLHKDTADELDKLIVKYQEFAEASGNPEAVAKLEQLKSKVTETRIVIDQDAQQIKNSLQSGFVDAFTAIGMKTKTVDQAMKDFFRSLEETLLKLIAQRLFERLFGSLLGGSNSTQSGGGGIMGFLTGLLGLGGGGSGGGGSASPASEPVIYTAAGGDVVQTDALYRLHARETVLPPHLSQGLQKLIATQSLPSMGSTPGVPPGVPSGMSGVPSRLEVSLTQGALNMTLRDWLEREITGLYANR